MLLLLFDGLFLLRFADRPNHAAFRGWLPVECAPGPSYSEGFTAPPCSSPSNRAPRLPKSGKNRPLTRRTALG
jgi:hypothetical protein